jgi:hypothetical protein
MKKHSITTIILSLLTAFATLMGMATPALAVTTQDLFRPFQYTSGAPADSKINIISNISKQTEGDWPTILGAVIRFVLAITGALAFISFTYAGVMMVSARGNEEQIKKGKDILLWSIFALIIIATSYALVLGVSQLKFG